MDLSALDVDRLKQALEVAEGAIGLSDPNPRVGCVIGKSDGTILGTGHTQAAGQAHAEVQALRDAQRQGQTVAGATAWVTLEPCSHHGRTPPCADALVAAGIQRVVVADLDPNPAVHGNGLARLAAANVEVAVASGAISSKARELNIGFYQRHEAGRPWIRLKLASSLDGKTALLNGQSKWITGSAARQDVQNWRCRASAILTGIGTVLTDNPHLNVRSRVLSAQPRRLIVDSQGRIGANANILQKPGRVDIFSTIDCPSRILDLATDHITWHKISAQKGRVDLFEFLARIQQYEINELHVECGPVLSNALLISGLVDELLLYVAPVLIGPGRPLMDMSTISSLEAAVRFDVIEHTKIDADLRLRLRPIAGQ